jgi:hypothetical protein
VIDRIDHSVENTLPMITHSTALCGISYLLRKMHFFHQKVIPSREAFTSDRMDQSSICLFLALKKLSARAVHNELNTVFGADVIA